MMGTMAISPCPLSVWWDMWTCPYLLHMSLDSDPSLLASKMQSVFLHHGLSPTIHTFSAYTDASQLSFSLQKALVNAGIRIHHTPPGQTNIKGFAMVVDMLIWVLEHPAPANIVVITSNTELANPLHKLRMKCYNIILITPQLALKSSLVLTKAAALVLTWPSLHILPEAMKHQLLSRKRYSTPFVDGSSMGKIDNTYTTTTTNNNNNAPRKRPPELDTAEPSAMINLKQRRIRDDDSQKRPDLDSLYMPPSNAGHEKEAEKQGMRSGKLVELKQVEAWLQSLMKSKAAAHGIPVSSLSDLFMQETGATRTLREILGNKRVVSGLLKFQHIIKLKRCGGKSCVFPVISQKPDMNIQEASRAEKVKEEGTIHIPLTEPSETGKAEKERIVEPLKQLAYNSPRRAALGSPYMPPPPNANQEKNAEQQGTEESLVLAKFEQWLQNLMQTKKAAKGIPISCLKDWFKHESGVTQKLRKLLGKGTLSAGLLRFLHIIRLELYSNEVFAFPVISQKDNMKASQAEKVNEEGTAHISLIESSETGKAKKRRIGESLELLVGNSPKRAALGSPCMPSPPPKSSQKKKAKQQGNKESLLSAIFEPWLQNLMQTKKAAKGILISSLKYLFKHESGMTQKLRKLLGEGTLSAGLLKFPHIIRLEQHGNEVFAFPVISQKDNTKASQSENVKGEGTIHIPLIEPSETGKAKKGRIAKSTKQLADNSPKRAALGSPYIPPPTTHASQKRKAKQQGTKESLVLAKFKLWLENLMQTKKATKGILISCLKDRFKLESGMTQKLQKLLGEGTLSAGLLKFPHIIRLEQHGNEVFAFPTNSQKDKMKASQAEKVKEEGTAHIPLIESSETGKTKKRRIVESLEQCVGDSPNTAALGSPYMPPPPTNASQKKKAKQQETKGSLGLTKFEPWLQSLPSETGKTKKRRIVESSEQLVGDSPKTAALGSPYMPPPPTNASQKKKAKQQETKGSLGLTEFEPWLQSLMQTKEADDGIRISSLVNLLKQKSDMNRKLRKLLGKETLTASLLEFPHIIRLEHYGSEVFAFPVISQKDKTKASGAGKVKEEGTVHICPVEPSETRKAKKRRIVESLEQLVGNSPKRAVPGSPSMPPPPTKVSQKKKAKQQGTKESLVLAKFEPWLQNLMQTKKASKGIPISCLEDWFKNESGMTQKLRKLLGKGTLSAGVLKFPHIIRLEQRGNEVSAFPVISQKDNTKASRVEKVKEEGTMHTPLIEPSETGKAKKGRIVESMKQLDANSPKRAALGSPYMPPLPTKASQKKKEKQQGTKESLAFAKFELWLQNLMQTKKASKGIPISCLKDWFKHESGMTQKLRNILGEGTLSAGLLKFPHIILIKQHGDEVFAFPVVSQKNRMKASQAEKVKEEGAAHISLIEPSETGKVERRRIIESLEQLAGNSPKRAALGSPCMPPPPTKAGQKRKAGQQGTKESLILAKFEPWLQNLMQTKKASKGIPISCLKDWFKHESGMAQKLQTLLGEGTLSAGLLKFPHIIRLEQLGNEVFAFPVISQKDITKANRAEKVKEKGTIHLPPIEPSETGKAKKGRIVESMKQLTDNYPKRAAQGSPYMPPPLTKGSQKKKEKQQGTKESLVLAKFEPWLQNLMQTKKASKGIPISCLKDWFKHESGMAQKLRKLLGEGTLSAGLLKFPHIIRLEHHGDEVFAFPVISQEKKRKASQAEKVNEEGAALISLIEPSEIGVAEKRKIVESLKQLASNSPKRVALGSPYMPSTDSSQNKKEKKQETDGSEGSAKFESWLQSLMQTKKAAGGIRISSLENLFKHESGMKQKLRKLLGKGTLSTALLKFPHIIRLEHYGTDVFAFSAISQNGDMKASQAEKVEEEVLPAFL